MRTERSSYACFCSKDRVVLKLRSCSCGKRVKCIIYKVKIIDGLFFFSSTKFLIIEAHSYTF